MLKFFILNLILVVGIHCDKPIGVSIERASLYDLSKPFACLDGSGVIPFEMINDDYCDCRDGSDEPGTNACLNGIFTCDNLGYVQTSLPSSRINDGICDCCDGSDEYFGKTKCENTCNILAEKMREDQEKAKQLLEVGMNKKRELVEKGAELRKLMRIKIEELESKRINAENEKIRFEEIKKSTESKAKEATDVEDKEHEDEKKRLEAIEKENKSNELFALLDGDKNGILSASELLSHNELDSLFDNDGRFTIEEAGKLIDHNVNLDKKTFFEQYYDKISPNIKFEEPTVTEQESQQETTEQELTEEEPEYSSTDESHHDEGDEHTDDHHTYPPTPAPQEEPAKSKYTSETQALLDTAEKARSEFQSADNDLRSIQNEIETLKRKLDYDVGSNEEFASLVDQCFEYDDREYIYKLCPYDRTVQKSKSNNGETSIGLWQSWDDENSGNKYNLMKFANGLTCWNGPARSTKVYLSCGTENKITSVSEPNRCEYEMKFETPTVCDENIQPKHDHSEL